MTPIRAVMGLHKLTAGDGYSYLTRQVAVHDWTEKGRTGLGEYYSQRGEAPGRWLGSGLTGLGMTAGEDVTAEQMKALFGEGRHPNARQDSNSEIPAHGSTRGAGKASALGRPFAVYSGVNDFQTAVARAFTATNLSAGRPANAAVPAADRARIRTDVATRMFTQRFDRPPADARELSGFIARESRQATTAVAGYDLTFSPVKSVSTLWALAPRAVAEQIEAAHDASVADTLAWLETHAAFTRTGPAGIRQVNTNGLIAAAFTHRDARSGDPDLHTHVAISNKVQTRDGRWLALDGRVLYKANVAASERYNTRLEAELTHRLGVRFTPRPGAGLDSGKRAVREITGVDPRLNEHWSSRRAAIDTRRAALAMTFQRAHGRAPTPVEAISLAQQATLETRQSKHEPRSLAEQRATWREQALQVLGGPEALIRMLNASTGGRPLPTRVITDQVITDMAASVLAVVQASRATWQAWHIRAEAERHARTYDLPLAQLVSLVDRVVSTAISPHFSLPLGVPDPSANPAPEPAVLTRSDGTSVYRIAGSQPYTSQAILDAERSLLTAARRTDGRVISPVAVGVALAESAANGISLAPGQAHLVTDLATSGARVQVVIAPAGSGKTTAMSTLTAAWTGAGGSVLGLAPSARAAAELRDALGTGSRETGTRSDTLAKLIHSLGTGRHPAWVEEIGPSTLVIIDEAGMAATTDLATTVDFVISRGGSVRLVGDDQQLASVAAGGILRDIADQVGALTLSELHRFSDPAEAAATLALRVGDPTALGFYLDHARVHVGDLATVTEHAYQAWSADRATGVDAVMLAPTRDLVATLNARARADRLDTSPQTAGREVQLSDGTCASAGDVILTRRNNRLLPISATDWVKNGDRWLVRDIHPTGALTALHLATNRAINLPADYVADHVELGYASTVHGAQGCTADTSHLIATGTESRQLLYVGMTRARRSNHVYVATAGDGDPDAVIRPEAVSPPTATDILTTILHRDDAQQSATSVARQLTDPAIQLHAAATQYRDALTIAAEEVLGVDVLTRIDTAADVVHPELTTSPAYPTLRATLALLVLNGTDPTAALRAVTGPGAQNLNTALDPAAVLDWRLHPTASAADRGGPAPWLPPIPAGLAENQKWGAYLTARAVRIIELDTAVRHQAAEWTPTADPAWASPLLSTDHTLLADLAVWRAATGVPEQDRRPTGPPQPGAAAAGHQKALDARVLAALGHPKHLTTPWSAFAERTDPRITSDPFWPQLADRLTAINHAGIYARGLLTAAAAQSPLPDEHPAAAVWWRLARHLTPATLTAISNTTATRPPWASNLTDQLGAKRAERVLDDLSWPALLAALSTPRADGWSPAALLTTAIGLTPTEVTDAELASALVWRMSMLTDPEPLNITPPPDPQDADLEPPEDLHLLTPDLNTSSDPATDDAAWSLDDPSDHKGRPADAVHLRLDRAIQSATLLRGPLEPTEAELWAGADEDYKWATAAVPKQRLMDLNNHAAAFFKANYPRSWAPAYLTDRVGTDLTDDDRFAPGYAPAGWTALTTHLRQHGATDADILAAGIGRVASTGKLIDQFRDRLVFPIPGPDGAIHGFIGRRNPTHDLPAGSGRAGGPKYLNTPGTDLFNKSAQLFGLHEGRHALANGAVPVLVEGPLDAIAITLASTGNHIGVAPLGTAFTDTHANQLLPHIGPGKPGVIVATDADTAGWKAGQRAYWQLVIRGDDPHYLAMPQGMDPAEILRTGGSAAIQHLLIDRQPLARVLINQRLQASTDPADSVTDIADIIAASPPERWQAHLAHAADQLASKPGTLESAVIDAASRWTADPRRMALRHIRANMMSATPPPAPPSSAAGTPSDSFDAFSPPTSVGQAWYETAPSKFKTHPDLDQAVPR